MQRIPHSASTRSKKKEEAPRNRKLANAALIGLSTLLVAGLGVAYLQNEQAQARNVAAASGYTASVADVPDTKVIRFVAVGDSITEANSPAIGEGRTGDKSWVPYAESSSIRYAGGWADGGAQTGVMLEKFRAVPGADVLVVLAGTNDVSNDVPFEETASNIAAIAEKADINRVVVSSIPPRDENPALAVEYNRQLERFVVDNGWEWVDAAAGLRNGDIFKAGLTSDGIHPTRKGAQVLGQGIQEAIAP